MKLCKGLGIFVRMVVMMTVGGEDGDGDEVSGGDGND